jgi:hypothetical protein
MAKSLSARLIAALDRPEIPKHVQREVHNAVCGPSAEDPPSYAWDTLNSSIMHYVRLLRSNKNRLHENVRPAVDAYRDLVIHVSTKIREADKSKPLPAHLTRWQEWVPQDVRRQHIEAVAAAYETLPEHRGPRVVPFAPAALRTASMQRLETLLKTTLSVREAWADAGSADDPKSTTYLGAVLIQATIQAERAIKRLRKRLRMHQLHPYEEPIKTNWHHYCEPETRAHVRALNAAPANVCFDFQPYKPYLAD